MINGNKRAILSFCLLLLSLAVAISLAAAERKDSLNYIIKNTKISGYLPYCYLEGKPYVTFRTLADVFKASSKVEFEDHRLYLNLYDEQFIFLLDTSRFSFRNANYNLPYPVFADKGEYYFPLSLVTEQLPLLFQDKVKATGKGLTIAQPKDNGIRVIVLDPGHGGKDPGAVGKRLHGQEKDINLSVCLRLKPLLEKELGVKVLMTRTDDRFVSLQDRTKFANDAKADLFICVHTNASRNRASLGAEVYYLSTAKTTEDRAVEALENSVVELFEGGKEAIKKYDDLALILSDILQAENLEQSSNLALKILMNINAGTRALDRGVKQANFFVLRGAYMPAVLVEMGFISNAKEEVYLLNEQYQERLARTIFEGIKSFKFRYDQIRSS